jgi:small acid-soluble spore protein F (minor alpha/beta-type SASP)
VARRNRSVMSEELKYELAKELGVADTVAKEGWGSVSSRDCGNLVRLAIERAEKAIAEENNKK